MKKLAIDLNSDVGEGFGPYTMGQDEELFQYITSANVACGYHAGDPSTIRKTLDLAVKHGIAVGAHPGYPDRLHFGRVTLPYSADEVTDFILYQIGALQLMAERAGLTLQHEINVIRSVNKANAGVFKHSGLKIFCNDTVRKILEDYLFFVPSF